MIKCTEMPLLTKFFSSLCNVFLSKFSTESLKYHFLNIESCICNKSCHLNDENSDFEHDDINGSSPESRTYRAKSPFGRYFSHIYETCRNTILMDNASSSKNNDNKNDYYYPEIIDYLLTYYFPIIPLWSGIILGSVTTGSDNKISHFSNAIAENWMRVVKIDILHSNLSKTRRFY